MRIGIYLGDLYRGRTDSHGIIGYALNLTRAIDAVLPAGDDLIVFVNETIRDELGHLDRAQLVSLPEPRTLLRRLTNDHIVLPLAARRVGVDVLHLPKGFAPLVWPESLCLSATMHDDIVHRYARGELGGGSQTLSQRWRHQYFSWMGRRSMRRCDSVITVSQTAATALGDLGVMDESRVQVAYEGPALPAFEYMPVESRHSRILIIGSRHPHKRSLRSIELCSSYVQGRSDDTEILVVGPLSEEAEQAALQARATRIDRFLPAPELSKLIAESRCLVFGSVYEGFGLPPVEAWTLGTPATHHRCSAMLEILQGIPGGHEIDDDSGFFAALDDLLAMDDVQIRAVQLEVASRFSWPEIACEIVRALHTAHGAKSRETRRP